MALKAKNDESKAAKPKKAKKKKKKEILDGERATQAQMHAIKMAKVNVAVRFLVTEAQYLMRCGRFNSAIFTVNRILNRLSIYDLKHHVVLGETMKEQTQLLMATRAEAFLRMGSLIKAVEDVNEVLEANPYNPLAMAVKGDALFQQCSFEHALVYYERGLRKSTEPLTSRFRQGKTRACDSIIKLLSESKVFNHIEDVAVRQNVTAKQKWSRMKLMMKTRIKKADPGEVNNKKNKKNKKATPTGALPPAKHLKDEAVHLRSLLNDPRGISFTVNSSNRNKFNFAKVVEDTLAFVESRDEFWASQ